MSDTATVPPSHARSQLAWWSALSGDQTSGMFLTSWLALLTTHIDHAEQALLVLGEVDSGPFETAARYPQEVLPAAICYDLADESLQSREVAVHLHEQALVIAYPVIISGRLYGSVIVQARDQPPETMLQQIRWGAGVLEAWLLTRQANADALMVERLTMVLDGVAKSLQGDYFNDAALALVTDLATRLSCDRISFGLRERERSTLLALSHSSKWARRMNLTRAICEAMDEAVDQNTTMYLPQDASKSLQVHAHQHLMKGFGNAHVLSIPFSPAPKKYGAMVFERPEGEGFSATEIQLCQSVAVLSGRILYRRKQQERRWWRRAMDAGYAEAEKMLGPKHIGRKLLGLALLGVVLFSVFAQGMFRIHAEATVHGMVQRTISAPYDGYISQAEHRAGDTVGSSQVLAKMDTHQIQLHLLQAQNQKIQYAAQAKQAMAQGSPSQAAIFKAQVRQAEAQVQFYRKQQQQAVIKAPFRAVIVSGDLSQRLGESVKRGEMLFKISPMDQYRLWLNVPGGDIGLIHVGQTGHVVLTAMPDKKLHIKIKRVVPLAKAEDGKSVFRVEAALDQGQGFSLRPGMEGIGKVDVGRKRYVWIWTRPFLNWLRLKWWAWFG